MQRVTTGIDAKSNMLYAVCVGIIYFSCDSVDIRKQFMYLCVCVCVSIGIFMLHLDGAHTGKIIYRGATNGSYLKFADSDEFT